MNKICGAGMEVGIAVLEIWFRQHPPARGIRPVLSLDYGETARRRIWTRERCGFAGHGHVETSVERRLGVTYVNQNDVRSWSAPAPGATTQPVRPCQLAVSQRTSQPCQLAVSNHWRASRATRTCRRPSLNECSRLKGRLCIIRSSRIKFQRASDFGRTARRVLTSASANGSEVVQCNSITAAITPLSLNTGEGNEA